MNKLGKNAVKISPYLVIFLLSLLPVIFTFGSLPIWGDTIMPLNSLGLNNYLYQWNSLRGGMYFSLNYLPYLIYFRIIEIFGQSPYIASAILLFLLKSTAGLGMFFVSKLLFRAERNTLYLPAIFLYLLSPSLLNSSHYLYIYSVAPWFLFFVFKIIKTKKMTLWDCLWITLLLFFGSVNLPNPKYIFHLFVVGTTTFACALYLGSIKFKFFIKNLVPLLLTIALSSYLIIPQLVFIKYYDPQRYDVHTKSGYRDVGMGIDYGESTLGRMWRLRKDSLNLNQEQKIRYTGSYLIIFLSFIFPTIIILHFLLGKKLKKDHRNTVITLLVLTVTYLFFASGHNPPLGFIYEMIISNFSLLAFLRTTAGASFFLSLFYSLLLHSLVLTQKNTSLQNRLVAELVLIICVIGYPHLSGEIYKNVEAVVPTDTKKSGFVLPEDYFGAKKVVDNFQYDIKFLYPRTDLSYISTSWGYFGVAIYDFLFYKDNLNCSRFETPVFKNVGVIFDDKSLLGKHDCTDKISSTKNIFKTNLIEIKTLSTKDIYPHFYTSASESSTLEFKRINPTKYRLRLHQAPKGFELYFLENYHQGWKTYLSKVSNPGSKKTDLSSYTISEENKQFQSTQEELDVYLKNNWVSFPINTPGSQTLFVSKKIKGTIQNNNLQNGKLWESWGLLEVGDKLKPGSSKPGSVNIWEINLEQLCTKNNSCIQNEDGSYELEILVEFEPQKYYYISLCFSVIIFLTILFFAVLSTIKSKKNE